MQAATHKFEIKSTLRQSAWIAPFGVLMFALGVRVLLISRTGFDGLYGQDSFAYLDYAAAMKTALAQGQAPPPFFWPIGYPALVVIFSALAPLASAAQYVNIAAGALVAVLTYLITRDLLRDQPGALIGSLFAGALVAVAGQMLISSIVAMSDATALLGATLSAFGMVRFQRTRRWAWLALAGFALGWAVMTRWIYALLIPVWELALVAEKRDASPSKEGAERGRARTAVMARSGCVSERRRCDEAISNSRIGDCFASFLATANYAPRNDRSPQQHPRSSAFVRVLILFAFFLLALAPQIALIVQHASRGVISHIGNAEIIQWNPTHAWQSNLVNTDGRFRYAWPVGVFYTLPLIHPAYIPLWFTPLLPLGVWALRRQRFFLILMLGWIGALWLFLIGITWENWRFPLALFPPLAILSGVGLNAVARHAPPRQTRIVLGWLTLGLLFTLTWGLDDAHTFIVRHRGDRAIVNWVSAEVPPDATVVTFGLTATLAHYSALRVVEISEESPDSIEKLARNGGDVFVLLDIGNIQAQWTGRAPQVNFHALRDRFSLQVIGTRAPFTLFTIRSAR